MDFTPLVSEFGLDVEDQDRTAFIWWRTAFRGARSSDFAWKYVMGNYRRLQKIGDFQPLSIF